MKSKRKESRQKIYGVAAVLSMFLMYGTVGGIQTERIDFFPGAVMCFVWLGAFAFFAWLGGAWYSGKPKKGARK